MNKQDENRALAMIGTMLDGFRSQSNTTQSKVMAYLIAVEGHTANTVESACKNFLRGSVKSHSSEFQPTAAELALECDRVSQSFVRTPIIGRDLIIYKAGEKPPKGYTALGDWKQRQQLLED